MLRRFDTAVIQAVPTSGPFRSLGRSYCPGHLPPFSLRCAMPMPRRSTGSIERPSDRRVGQVVQQLQGHDYIGHNYIVGQVVQQLQGVGDTRSIDFFGGTTKLAPSTFVLILRHIAGVPWPPWCRSGRSNLWLSIGLGDEAPRPNGRSRANSCRHAAAKPCANR